MGQETLKKICIIGDKETVNKLCNQKLDHLNAEDHDAAIGFINYRDDNLCPFQEIPFNSLQRSSSSTNLLLPSGTLKDLISHIAEADVIFIAASLKNDVYHIQPADLALPLLARLNLCAKSQPTQQFYILGNANKKKTVEVHFSKISMEYVSEIEKFQEKLNEEAHTTKQPRKEDVPLSIGNIAPSFIYISPPNLRGPKIGFFTSLGVGGTVGLLATTGVIPLTPLLTPIVIGAIIASAAAALLCLVIASCISKAAQKNQLTSGPVIAL